MGWYDEGTKRMSPCAFHVPPRGSGTSAIACGSPPDRLTFLSLPSAKNAIHWLSGDQNGWEAPSVPDKCRAADVSKVRNHSSVFPVDP